MTNLAYTQGVAKLGREYFLIGISVILTTKILYCVVVRTYTYIYVCYMVSILWASNGKQSAESYG